MVSQASQISVLSVQSTDLASMNKVKIHVERLLISALGFKHKGTYACTHAYTCAHVTKHKMCVWTPHIPHIHAHKHTRTHEHAPNACIYTTHKHTYMEKITRLRTENPTVNDTSQKTMATRKQ